MRNILEIDMINENLKVLSQDPNVLVPTARNIHDYQIRFLHVGRAFHHFGNSMCRFERRNNSFCLRQQFASVERLGIGSGNVFRSLGISKPRVLRPDGRVVQPCRNRVRRRDLTGFVLQNI